MEHELDWVLEGFLEEEQVTKPESSEFIILKRLFETISLLERTLQHLGTRSLEDAVSRHILLSTVRSVMVLFVEIEKDLINYKFKKKDKSE